MKAIIKRDFLSFFHTFTGWLFIAVLWAFISFFVANYNFLGLNAQITSSLSSVEIVFLILMPILTMRSFADEKRLKTDQLLFTSPVSIGKVVFGKFVAVSMVYTIPVLMTCLYPLILSLFGKVNFSVNYVGILGMWLYGLACIAICIFASSLTENLIIAAVLGFVFLFIAYMIPSIQNMVDSSSATAAKVIGAFGITTRFESFLNGSFDITAVIYMVVAIALFLFFTTQVIQKRRYSISKNTFSFGAYSSVMIVVAIAASVVLNLAASQLPSTWKNVDLTSTGLYSISDETKKIVGDLNQDVTVYVLNKEDRADDTISHMLKNYQAASSHIKVTYIDPAANPTFIQQYTDDSSNLYLNSLVVVCGDRSKVINYSDIYLTSMDYQTYQTTTTGFDGEGQLTSAIDYVTNASLPKVYTLTGHGEKSLSNTFSEGLTKLNVETASLDLMQNDTVPDDAQAVLILAPTSDLSSDDVQKLEAYFDKGGNLIAETNYQATGDMTNFKSLLSYFGVSYGDGVVLDSDSSKYYQYQSYLLPNVESSSVTSGVTDGNGYVMVPFAQELTTDSSAKDITYTPLLMTSEDAYVHANVDTTDDLQSTSEDKMAARTIGVMAVKSLGSSSSDTASDTSKESVSSTSGTTTASSTADSAAESVAATSGESVSSTSASAETSGSSTQKSATAIVYSSPFVFNDNTNELVSGSNLSLFTGSISAVTNTDSAVSIPSKDLQNTSLTIPQGTAVILLIIFVILIPIALLAIGLMIWLRRRKL